MNDIVEQIRGRADRRHPDPWVAVADRDVMLDQYDALVRRIAAEGLMKPEAYVIDANGWRTTDEVLPPNLATVLIWNSEQESVQFAEFKMYSAKRYEFVQGSDVLSIHSAPFWQPEPKPPVGSEHTSKGDE